MQKNIKHNDMYEILMHATLIVLNINFLSKNRLQFYVDKEVLSPYISIQPSTYNRIQLPIQAIFLRNDVDTI